MVLVSGVRFGGGLCGVADGDVTDIFEFLVGVVVNTIQAGLTHFTFILLGLCLLFFRKWFT